jgi:hypothetical protein
MTYGGTGYVDPAVKALREAGQLGWPVDHGRVFASRIQAPSVAANSNESPSSRNALPPLMPTGCGKCDALVLVLLILIVHARHCLLIRQPQMFVSLID